MVTILTGDCREVLKTLPDASVNCCVTSPPYFGLRDYGHAWQIGLEFTPDAYVAELVAVFREVRRVLRDDGTLFLNLGDSYANDGKWGGSSGGKHVKALHGDTGVGRGKVHTGLKPKDLIGIPWRVAFALQADGWWLRQDIIWAKPNPMPESVTDRCTKSHEYIFLLSKSARYYFDAEAIAEPVAESTLPRSLRAQTSSARECGVPGQSPHSLHEKRGRGGRNAFRGQWHFRDAENGPANRDGRDMRDIGTSATRNKRDVWTVATQPYKGAHFATFPPDLIKPCILAGCPAGGTVLDPFGGSGTTGSVASGNGRRAVLVELNPEYAKLATDRCGLFCSPNK